MKSWILIALSVVLFSNFTSAQNGRIVFGPLEADTARVMIVENGASLSIPVWIRTIPGVNIVAVHWPLSTNNEYIASREGGVLFYPFPEWDDVGFIPPNADNAHPGYTNQGVLGIKDLIGTPDPNDGIETDGEWWHVADYYITADGTNPIDTLLTDALIAGFHSINGGFVWADFVTGELPANSFEYYFSSLIFADNSDPVWCDLQMEYCGDAGATLCIDLCGADANLGDDLHIVQISGGGQYTESEGGPGGYTSGTWCGSLPEGVHTLAFELWDNMGGVTPLEITVEMRPVSLEIGVVEGFPGGNVAIPVTLNVCDFEMGGMELLIGWDSSSVTLTHITPTGRIDEGNEYWNVDTSNPCELCPDTGAVRIVWISDIDNGVHHSPAYVGDEPVFFLTFRLRNDLQIGTIQPISFMNYHYYDNTISDSAGFSWFRPGLIDGHIEIIDPSGYKGDPNMNGISYEVGDALLVVRYLAYGDVVWTENGTWDDAIQKSSADLNNNGIIDIPDLIRLINIINGKIEPPKLDPALGFAEIGIASIGSSVEISIESDLNVGGVLLSIDHRGMDFGAPVVEGMDVMTNDVNGTMRVVIYSLAGNTIEAGSSTLLTVPVVSNRGGRVEITEASSADEYGRPLETAVVVDAPLPTEYAISPNYPNPFNARTTISFALPQASHVTVEIYDLLGRNVATLVDSDFPAGYHNVTWDAAERSSGVYFYKVRAGEFARTQKMLLLK